MAKRTEPTLREAAKIGRQLVRDKKIRADVAELLKVLLHSADQVLSFRDAQLAKAKRARKAGKS